MKTHVSTTEKRFRAFATALANATGDKAVLYRGCNTVAVLANPFTPRREFRSVQDAIDSFSHLINSDI